MDAHCDLNILSMQQMVRIIRVATYSPLGFEVSITNVIGTCVKCERYLLFLVVTSAVGLSETLRPVGVTSAVGLSETLRPVG